MGKRAALLIAFVSVCAVHAESDPNIPESLQAWRDKSYTQRYFLRVDAPGEAGATGLQPDPPAASVILPLKMVVGADKQEVPESILLIGEDNVIYPVLARKIAGGTEAEIAFATRPGLRRFCLYAGAPPNPQAYSPTTFQTQALRVKVRGRSIPGELAWTENHPLTLEAFQKIAERNDGVLGDKPLSNIDDPECPWFALAVDQSGHVNRKENPQRYGAVYEGFLRTPVAGSYKFAVDTPGAVQLLINGKPVVGAEKPDNNRLPFALTGTVELGEGVQRVTLYYAEANARFDKSNADLARFGLRLHWQPPFATEMLCIPAQAFPRALPAVVTRYETVDGGGEKPFIHVEILGHVRTGMHLGESQAREFAFIYARGLGAPLTKTTLCAAWLSVEQTATINFPVGTDGKRPTSRTFKIPARADGARDVMDLEAELSVKSAPEFVYPDETAHFHVESVLSPAPVIIPKERRENNLLPPPPRPMGEFSLRWWFGDSTGSPLAETKIERCDIGRIEVPRDKQRVSISGTDLEKHSKPGTNRLNIQLTAGDVPADGLVLRLLHSRAAKWPDPLIAGAGSLLIEDGKKAEPQAATTSSLLTQIEESKPGRERVLIVVPREDEDSYRQFAPLKTIAETFAGKDALFIGDPLVEVSTPKDGKEIEGDGKPNGLAARIATAYGGFTWQFVLLPGPHHQLPIYRMIAALDEFSRKAPNGRLPETVVLSLGGGDAARQTPPHNFERGLDIIIDRLRQGGTKRIVMIGVIPEPFREKQGEAYQDRLNDLLRQHHVDGIDVLHAWTKESDWARRFALESSSDAVYGATPNASALDEIVKLLKERL